MKKRTITAIALTAVLLPLILLGGIPYLIGIMALMCICMYELTNVNQSSILTRSISIASILLATLNAYFNINNYFMNYNLLFIFVPTFLFFTIALFNKKGTLLDACYNSIITILFSLFATSLLELRYTHSNANLVVYLLLITSSVDTFALFTGCKFGKHRLNERISPKKSIEGSIGGIIGGTIIGTLFSTFFPILANTDATFLNLAFSSDIIWKNFGISLMITVLLTIVGQIGDLLFSMIKLNTKL